MRVLCDICDKNIDKYIKNKADGFILYLKDFSISNGSAYFGLDEIKDIVSNNEGCFFISINKNMFNDDLVDLENILIELSKIKITGILFYDMSILEIKRRNNLDINLVWNQEHMVTNYNTCNYYYNHGVKYAILSNEITKNEMIEIRNQSDIIPIVQVVGRNNIAVSRRKLINNYYKNFELISNNKLEVLEKVSGDKYLLIEDNNGCSFTLDKITNGISIIKELYDNKFEYIVLKEFGIDNSIFLNLVLDTINYINEGCVSLDYISKHNDILGEYTGFLFKKTVYKVK